MRTTMNETWQTGDVIFKEYNHADPVIMVITEVDRANVAMRCDKRNQQNLFREWMRMSVMCDR